LLNGLLEVQRLTANIFHLNGQLTLASAIMQQKDMLLAQKDTVIHQQRQIIDGQILVSSIQKDAEDTEPLVTDIVSVKKYDLYGFEFDLPTLLRRLKQRFGKEQ
jgi:hypothetical protein